MADRNAEHPWGTCDGCGVDLGGVCCYSPHQFGDYDTLCGTCFAVMKREADERWRREQQHRANGCDAVNGCMCPSDSDSPF